MKSEEIIVENYLTSKLFAKAANDHVPLGGTFELSPVCNFSCKMCYVRKTKQEIKQHNRPMMEKDQWLRIAREAKKQGLLYLLLTGGEPFLWPDFWDLYEELIKMGFVLSINTNGSLIDDVAIEKLMKNPPSRINITLYGADDETYESLCGAKNVFSKVDQSIKKLKAAGIMVKLNCSLTPQNAKDLERIVKYAEENQVILSVNTYMFPPIRRDSLSVGKNERFTPKESAKYNLKRYLLQYGKERYKTLLYDLRDNTAFPPGLDEGCVDPVDGKVRCRAGKASFWITWDGFMTPCGMMPNPKVSVTDKSFSEAWDQLTKITEEIRLSGLCSKCPNQKICHACAAMAQAETGSTKKIPTYLCEMVKELHNEAKEQLEKQVD